MIADLKLLWDVATVETTATAILLNLCAVQDSTVYGDVLERAGVPDDLGAMTVTDSTTGQLIVEVPGAYVAAVDAQLAEYGDAYRVQATDALVSFQGRGDP